MKGSLDFNLGLSRALRPVMDGGGNENVVDSKRISRGDPSKARICHMMGLFRSCYQWPLAKLGGT